MAENRTVCQFKGGGGLERMRGEVDTLMHTMGRCRLLRSLLIVSLIVADRCELLRGLFCITSWVTGIVVE